MLQACHMAVWVKLGMKSDSMKEKDNLENPIDMFFFTGDQISSEGKWLLTISVFFLLGVLL